MTNLIIVMGVSGCGKSTVASDIAQQLNYEFVEADDFHPEENVTHMASGKPLTDAMRQPWLALLRAHLKRLAKSDKSAVMSFSGLRRAHRSQMRDLPFKVLFLHLAGEQALIYDRMRQRKGHYMPASLLDSQYQALENTDGEPSTFKIDISQSLERVINDASQHIKQSLNL